MLRIPRKYRFWVFIFALWLAVEPLAIQVCWAEDIKVPTATINSSGEVKGIEPIDQVMTPSEYLEYMLELRGASKESQDSSDPKRDVMKDIECKAYADWLMSISSVYMMMGDGSQDVFSFYSTMRSVKQGLDQTTAPLKIPKILKAVSRASKALGFLFAFLSPNKLSVQMKNLFHGFAKSTVNAAKALEKSRTFKFLAHMAPPPAWNTKVAGEGMKSYVRWVRKVGGGKDTKFVISNSKGIARTIGIGLTVFAVALDAIHLYKSDDVNSGRLTSFDTVSHGVSAILGLAVLVCMFVPPPFGQIAGALVLIWGLLTTIGGIIGDMNRRWKEAYQNSFWYLYGYDEELKFKSFYENRSELKPQEKSASLLLAEKDFGDELKKQKPETDEEKAQYEKGVRVFEALEKQGVLMTYYNHLDYSLDDYDNIKLMELWRMKANFMAWKSTEKEAAADKKGGFWRKFGKIVNPMTYVKWAGDKIGSRKYNKEIEKSNIKRVFFNPDYALVKRYVKFLMGKNLRGDIYDLVGLRIEQAPFNYIPLVGIDSGTWTDELLTEAFHADAFIIGSKEMIVFKEIIKNANATIKESTKAGDDLSENVSIKGLPFWRRQRSALQALLKAYKDGKDEENAKLFHTCQEAFGWNWNESYGKKTAKNIIDFRKADVEQVLEFLPIGAAQMAAELVLLNVTLKSNLDTSKLMLALGKEREEAVSDEHFNKEFKNESIRKFLDEGSFLDIKGSTTLDWFSAIYPAREELRKWTVLYMKEADKYASIANQALSDTRDGFLGIDYKVKEPKEVLEEVNTELEAMKEMIDGYQEISEEADIRVVLAEPEANGKVFKEGGYQLVNDLVALDLDVPVGEPEPAASGAR